jgi:hypothetical protein
MISKTASMFDQHDVEDRVREIFHEIDANGDGVIDEEELVNALEKLCFTATELSNEANKERILSEFKKIDKDNDGSIDFNEFVLYYNNMLSFQMHECNSTSKAGTSVDLWSRGDMSAYEKVIDKLLKRKKISRLDYDHIKYMFETKFCLLDLKMAISKYRRSESILPLKRFLDKFRPTIQQRKALDEEYWNLDPKEILHCDEVMNKMIEKKQITIAEKIRVDQMLKQNIQTVELKAAFFEYEHNPDDVHLLKNILELNESTILESKNFNIKQANVVGANCTVPVMDNKYHSKEQFMSLMTAASVFYATPDIEFDTEMIMQMKHIVDMLHKRGFLNKDLATKAKHCIQNGDPQCIYALYKYDTDFERLNTYLKFKIDDASKEAKNASISKRHQSLRDSLEADRLERLSCLEAHQESLGGTESIKKSRNLAKSKQKEKELKARGITTSINNNTTLKKKKQKKIPRWKQLYNCKFESYAVILEHGINESGKQNTPYSKVNKNTYSKYVVNQP